ncbi:ABC transporter substrate-binding protein [Desulfovibrio sp. JC010]|uniref:substrate-binding periplasmic protein n=1 Tax=Desulfovibrio sp. JC010 TaxID=2593641 RepID=UPI0013D2C5A9|nr:transporter substrate-binding domain-containing protein [Desulfovibrio sp. JC010]NDV28181.1 amino acid ABC transporter substrate-binding protein [Desulfovibrio sp. JC010]
MRFFVILFIVVSAVFSTSSVQASKGLSFYTHFIKPFAYEEEGRICGFAVEVVREMMKLTGQSCEIEMLPFARGLKLVQSFPEKAFFIVAKRPERLGSVKWVGPLVTSGVYFYKAKGKQFEADSLEEMKQLESVCVGRGNADHTYLESLGFENLVPVNNQMVSLQLLVKGRVDVTPVSEMVMPAMAQQAGIDVSKIESTGVKLYDSELFLVFSKETPEWTVAKWQAALDELKRNGTYRGIYSKYILQQ